MRLICSGEAYSARRVKLTSGERGLTPKRACRSSPVSAFHCLMASSLLIARALRVYGLAAMTAASESARASVAESVITALSSSFSFSRRVSDAAPSDISAIAPMMTSTRATLTIVVRCAAQYEIRASFSCFITIEYTPEAALRTEPKSGISVVLKVQS